tara:strand:- start:17532 stop:17882 length:351 start_codon:yes stop_codon:yes gene_type:complete
MRVLAFEDIYDMEAMFVSAGIDLSGVTFQQRWDSSDALEHIESFSPDVLLLDHFMAPLSGYEVLEKLLESQVMRPDIIVAMSSESSKNQAMVELGANYGTVKFNVTQLGIWPGHSS